MKKTLLNLLFLTNIYSNMYSKLINGDSFAAAGTTFDFTVGFTVFDHKTPSSAGRWWIATNDATIASKPDETKKYGLSLVYQTASYIDPSMTLQAVPMANSENATIYSFNGTNAIKTSLPNPIWGGTFTNFDITMQHPTFTVLATPNLLYNVDDIQHFESPAQGTNITSLLVHDFGTSQEIKALLPFADAIYTAYSQGAFGSTPSNIAIIQKILAPVDDTTSHICLQQSANLPITPNVDALKGGPSEPDLAAIGTNVTFGNVIKKIYLGIQATSNAGGVAVAIAQVLLSYANNVYSIILQQIAPTSVLTAGVDTPISAQGGNSIRITHTTGLVTSTNLQYLVVARDNGTGPETLYALPLVSKGTNTGMIADFTSVKTVFGKRQPIFVERYFDTVISDATQISLTNPAIINQIRVGGSNPLPIDATNNLQQMYVVGDGVYAVIGNQYTTTQAPGTYKSQAIFAPQGHIVGWTAWSRVLGSDVQMQYSSVDGNTLTGLYVAATTSSPTPEFKSIYQTTFTQDSHLTALLKEASQGGFQGIFDFNVTTPGFGNALSMLIATSYGKISMGQTGLLNGGIFMANSLTDNDVVTYEGASLNNHQALVAAEIAHDASNNHWIFVGGTQGLSVFTYDNTGYSWNGTLGSIAQLCCNSQNWKKVGDFSNIKKLVWDATYLYVLTDTHLYQILLDPNKFTATPTTPLNVTTILSSSELSENTYFLDIIIDQGVCLLGTTSGLYMVNQGVQKIAIPNNLPAISNIRAISANPNPQRSFTTLSNIYVLSNTFGTQQAQIHRLVFQNGVIALLPDTYAAIPGSTSEGKHAPFIIFDNFISNFFVDGSWNIANSYFAGPNQPGNSNATPFVQQIFAGIRSGLSSSQTVMQVMTNNAPLWFIKQGTNILPMIRETTSGAVIAAGDFQAHTNA